MSFLPCLFVTVSSFSFSMIIWLNVCLPFLWTSSTNFFSSSTKCSLKGIWQRGWRCPNLSFRLPSSFAISSAGTSFYNAK